MEKQWGKISLLELAVLLGLTLLGGCGKKTTEPNNPPPPIRGKVIDASGKGVKDVSVLLEIRGHHTHLFFWLSPWFFCRLYSLHMRRGFWSIPLAR